MKKKKVLFGLALAMSTAVLASCGGAQQKTAVMEGTVVNKNLPVQTSTTTTTTTTTSTQNVEVANLVGQVAYNSFSDDGTVVMSDFGNILKVKNKQGYIGFYSKLNQKYIIAPKYFTNYIQDTQIMFSNSSSSTLGEIIRIKYNDQNKLFDSFGNTIMETKDDITAVTVTTVKKVAYVTVTTKDKDEYVTKKIYSYTSNDKITEVTEIPTETVDTSDITYEAYTGQKYGDTYVSEDKVDLKEYGIDGKYLVNSDGLYTVFENATNKKVSTFAVPNGATRALVGKYMIYQLKTELPDTANDYAYSSYYGTKYGLETYRIDIEKGTSEKLDAKVVINTATSYKDEEGIYNYILVGGAKIDSNKALPYQTTYILNEKCEIVDDLTEVEPGYFIQIGENYYNTTTQIIYSADMAEIAYIGDANPVHDKTNKLFICYKTDKLGNKLYGAIDYSGKIVIQFEYSSIVPLEAKSDVLDQINKCVIATKKDTNGKTQYFRVNYSTGAATYLSDKVVRMNFNNSSVSSNLKVEDLYVSTTKDKDGKQTLEFINQEKTLATVTGTHENSVLTYSTTGQTFTLGKATYYYIMVTDTWTDDKTSSGSDVQHTATTYLTFAIDQFTGAIANDTDETTTQEHIGLTMDDAKELFSGESNVNLGINGKDNYFEYKATESGNLVLDFEDTDVYVDSIVGEDGTIANLSNPYLDECNIKVSVTDSLTNETFNRHIVTVEKGKTYYINIKASYEKNKYTKVNVYMATAGMSKYNPADIEINAANLTKLTYNEFGSAFVRVTLEEGINNPKLYLKGASSTAPKYNVYKIFNNGNRTALTIDKDSDGKYSIDDLNVSLSTAKTYILEISRGEVSTDKEVSFGIGMAVDATDLYNANTLTDGGTYTLKKGTKNYFTYKNTTDSSVLFKLPTFLDNSSTATIMPELTSSQIDIENAYYKLPVEDEDEEAKYVSNSGNIILPAGAEVVVSVQNLTTKALNLKAKLDVYTFENTDGKAELSLSGKGEKDGTVSETSYFAIEVKADGKYKLNRKLVKAEDDTASHSFDVSFSKLSANGTYTSNLSYYSNQELKEGDIVIAKITLNAVTVADTNYSVKAVADITKVSENVTFEDGKAKYTQSISYKKNDENPVADENVKTVILQYEIPKTGYYRIKNTFTDNKVTDQTTTLNTNTIDCTYSFTADDYRYASLTKGQIIYITSTINVNSASKDDYDLSNAITLELVTTNGEFDAKNQSVISLNTNGMDKVLGKEMLYAYYDLTNFTNDYGYTFVFDSDNSNAEATLYKTIEKDGVTTRTEVTKLNNTDDEYKFIIQEGYKYYVEFKCNSKTTETKLTLTKTVANITLTNNLYEAYATADYYVYKNTTTEDNCILVQLYDKIKKQSTAFEYSIVNVDGEESARKTMGTPAVVKPGELLKVYVTGTSKTANTKLIVNDLFKSTALAQSNSLLDYEKGSYEVKTAVIGSTPISVNKLTVDNTASYKIRIELDKPIKDGDSLYCSVHLRDKVTGELSNVKEASMYHYSTYKIHEVNNSLVYVYEFDLDLSKNAEYYVAINQTSQDNTYSITVRAKQSVYDK